MFVTYAIMGALFALTVFIVAPCFVPEYWKERHVTQDGYWYAINWMALSLGIVIHEIIITYPHDVKILFDAFIYAKFNFWAALLVGFVFSLLTIVATKTEFLPIRVLAISVATIIFIPGIYIDWHSLAALTAAAGKLAGMIIVYGAYRESMKSA